MRTKKAITIWQRYSKEKQKYIHNHIEDGHQNGSTIGGNVLTG